jgi:hypothetical protein
MSGFGRYNGRFIGRFIVAVIHLIFKGIERRQIPAKRPFGFEI